MRAALSYSFGRRLGPVAARMTRKLPRSWRSTARRRRFLLLVLSAPGFAAVAALPVHKSLWALLGGTFAIVIVCAVRALAEPTLMLGDDRD
jgi:hypothetical protein